MKLFGVFRAAQRGFRPIEFLLAGSSFSLLLCAIIWAALADRAVAWPAFAPGIGVAHALFWVGVVARGKYPKSRLGTCSVGLGIFFLVSIVVSIVVLLSLPLSRPLVDAYLTSTDAALGFDWDAFVAQAMRYPLFTGTLRLIYAAAVPEVALLVAILASTGREHAMHRLLVSGTLSLVAAVAFWRVFPSIGPAPFSALSSDTLVQSTLFHSPQEALVLMNLVTVGPKIVLPGQVLGGWVAFPSIHMVMALMVAWYSRGTWAFVPLCLSSLLMIPATLLHGGHHLVDLIGGLALFIFAASGANWIVKGTDNLVPTTETGTGMA